MPFVIVRTRASGAGVTVDAPNVLLKHLKSVCTTKEDKAQGFKQFKFQWLHSSESYRGGLEGKLECTHMSVRKILNTIEACGWMLVSTHSYGDSGSEYIMAQNPNAANVIGGGLPNKEPANPTTTMPDQRPSFSGVSGPSNLIAQSSAAEEGKTEKTEKLTEKTEKTEKTENSKVDRGEKMEKGEKVTEKSEKKERAPRQEAGQQPERTGTKGPPTQGLSSSWEGLNRRNSLLDEEEGTAEGPPLSPSALKKLPPPQ
eukprot:comp22784_c0_seq2/m.35674 comp22784_c0_seq2/g.35674  ORF comp22784_c0_seq2/g.35674 comp22784_c0_seq2/m.35674 type:complete len:257 (-) comp22784_c0_seq2:142-912(-)